jgi:hypothetical protein
VEAIVDLLLIGEGFELNFFDAGHGCGIRVTVEVA